MQYPFDIDRNNVFIEQLHTVMEAFVFKCTIF